MFKRKLEGITIRVVALLLVLLCSQKAWAAFWFYQGKAAFDQKALDSALSSFQKSQQIDPKSSKSLFYLARTQWEIAEQTKDFGQLIQSKNRFKEFTLHLPFYARGWIYQALAVLRSEERSADGVTQEEWNSIQPIFEKAIEQEPGSAWIKFMSARSMLRYDNFLNEPGRKKTSQYLKESVLFHDPDQPSPFLKPALAFLWRRYASLEFLKELTPNDLPSYQVLVDFLSQDGLWHLRDQVYPKLLLMNQRQEPEEAKSDKTYFHLGEKEKTTEPSPVTYEKLPEAWWAEKGQMKNRLEKRETLRVGLNLKPGIVQLGIQLRGGKGERLSSAYLKIFLCKKEIGTTYVENEEWREANFETRTNGGKCSLEVDLLNGKTSLDSDQGPWVELGKVQIHYPS